MLSRRRYRNRTLINNLADVQRRLRYLERRPARTSLSDGVVDRNAIGSRAVGPDQADFGIVIVKPPGAAPDWGDGLPNLNDGDLIVDPDTGAIDYYDGTQDAFFPVAGGGSETYYSDTEPAGANEGDIWFDSNDGFKLYRYDGTTWISVQDAAIEAAKNAANAAQNTADGKNRIYRQPNQPTGGTYSAGDIWFDTDSDNVMYRYGLTTTATVAFKQLTNNVATLTTSAPHEFAVQEQITVTGVDSVFNGTYTITAVPNSTSFRYAKTNANISNTATTGTVTSNAGWKPAVLGDNAIVSIGATKITAGTLDVGVIYAGSINTNQISAGTLSVGVIYAGNILTSQITAGTLNAGVIYSGTINASQINTGTINGAVVNIKSNTSATGTQQRIEINSSGFYAYDGTQARVEILSSGVATLRTVIFQDLQSTGYSTGTGMALAPTSTSNTLLFNVSGVAGTAASIVTVAGGLVITSGSSQLVMTASGAVYLTGSSNGILLATAPYLNTSGDNTAGAYGSIRNIFASSGSPTGGVDGDVWLKWV